MTMREMVASNPNLTEANSFLMESSVMDDIDAEEYGSELTMLLPMNEAWKNLPQARRDYLMDPDHADDLETLLLFSTTDTSIERDDTFDGMRIITLLGVEAELDKTNNRICVLSIYDGAPYQCATVVEWDLDVDEGVAHVIDQALLPEELEELFEEMGI